VKHDVLNQHVLGVLVHSRPRHKAFLYTFNDTIKGDANTNIEGIRRTLASLYSDKAMPRIVAVQGDNASDNKCWAVLLFLGMLVYHKYTNIVYFSFLLVGHTHEDIDQLFSIISRHFKSLPPLEGKTPQAFATEMAASLEARFELESEPMLCTADCELHPTPEHTPPPVPPHSHLLNPLMLDLNRGGPASSNTEHEHRWNPAPFSPVP
jgi:hypothetical protein